MNCPKCGHDFGGLERRALLAVRIYRLSQMVSANPEHDYQWNEGYRAGVSAVCEKAEALLKGLVAGKDDALANEKIEIRP